MKILNLTRCTTITNHTEIATSFLEKMRGLMFRERLEEGRGMLMMFRKESRHAIWMFGMRFPIDLIFINSERRVVGITENFSPLALHPKTWKVSKPGEECKYVLEVNSGVARKTGTKLGDEIEFVF